MRSRREGKPLYDFVEFDVSELHRFPNALQDIYDRKMDGLIVRNVYSRDEMARTAERLEWDDPPFPRIPMPWGHTVGRVLVRAGADLTPYFETAEDFREDCRRLFAGNRGFEERLEEVMGAMAGGRKMAIPRGPDGSSYTPATVRVLGEGGDLALHCGNQFLHTMPEFRHLWTLVLLEDQLSYFMPLSTPEGGGELVLFALEWADATDSTVDGRPVKEVIDRYEKMPVAPGAGDLLVFDGGRIWHLVSAVRGPRKRVTIGGFAAFSLDQQSVYYWS